MALWGMVLLAGGCVSTSATNGAPKHSGERLVRELNMNNNMKHPNAEYSALAWCANSLIMVPQYPESMCSEGNGCLYMISEKNLQAALENGQSALHAKEIVLYDHGLKEKMVGYEGYEALDCDGDNVFMTVEAATPEGMRAYLVRGTLDLQYDRLDLDNSRLAVLKAQTGRRNASYEALMVKDGVVYAFYEHYNKIMNPDSYVYRFDYDLNELAAIDGFDLWYRLTDIGGFDKNGTLWVLNYNFPKSAHESEKNKALDPLAKIHGHGPTHQKYEHVERLVPMVFSKDKISVNTAIPPVEFQLLEKDSRNWEGLAVWPDHGFFVVTDKFPGSILGYVEF